jgi:hypothetical protein
VKELASAMLIFFTSSLQRASLRAKRLSKMFVERYLKSVSISTNPLYGAGAQLFWILNTKA